MNTPSHLRALASALFASMALISACGSDAATTLSAADTAEFCDATAEMRAAIDSQGDPTVALAAAVAAAPTQVGKNLSEFGEKLGAAAASGDENAFLADDVRQIASTAQMDIAEICSYQIAEVDLDEYTFAGLPAKLASGPTAIHMTNTGDQVHEMLLYRRADGTTGDLIDIVNEDPSVSDGRLKLIGVALPAASGEDSVLLVDLAAGDYVIVCFLPVGMSSMDQLRSGQDSSPMDDHRSQGMISAFTVG